MLGEILIGKKVDSTDDIFKIILSNEYPNAVIPTTCILPQWAPVQSPVSILKREKNCHRLLQGCTSQSQYDIGYRVFDRASGSLGKGSLLLEYADSGTGDFRPPSFQCVCPNGSTITPLKYMKHQIILGKVAMNGFLPHVRCDELAEASTLIVTLADRISGLEVDLIYTCMHNYDAIIRRSVFRNTATCSTCHSDFTGLKTLGIVCSMTMDMPTNEYGYWITKLSGSWARERYIEETPLVHGCISFTSSKGVSSHEHQPFVCK